MITGFYPCGLQCLVGGYFGLPHQNDVKGVGKELGMNTES